MLKKKEKLLLQQQLRLLLRWIWKKCVVHATLVRYYRTTVPTVPTTMGDERGGCCSSGSDTGRRELILATEPLHQVLDKQKIKMLSHLPELPRLDIEFSELLYTVPEGRKVASEHGYETRGAGIDPGLVSGFGKLGLS
uniref:Uncharacterized protein n=1 Tax=Timema shepardi TaxID=629360 RepID=A0A7R9B1C7_TIMSH|nr:unnamed protein product [Timema shepardi]